AEPALPLAAAEAPTPGSTDPIKPLLVKTVSVQPSAVQTAALSPLPSDSGKLVPAPATASPAAVTTITTVRTALPLPPAKPVQPAQPARPAPTAQPVKVASVSAAVPAPAAQDLAARPRGGWMIQVGAFDTEAEAKDLLGKASPFTEPVAKGDKTLYRARFAGLEKAQAEAACKNLKRSEIPCMLLKN